MQQDREFRDPPVVLIAIAVAAVLGGGYYYWMHNERPAQPAPAAPVAQGPAAAETPIRYPIQTPAVESAPALPSLAESDGPMQQQLTDVLDKASLERFFYLDSLVRRVVVTVDNLARPKVPQRYHAVKPAPGKFLVTGKEDKFVISAANYQRYTPYVQLAEAVDTKKLVAVYRHFYPLFQEEYRNLAHPKQYFNDRVVEVIDDLLAAPDVKQPVRLVRPKVFYEYEDLKLESLSAGQKLMLRIGSDNAARVKAKLRDIRAEITAVR
jgi:hypothetical protein